MTRKFVLLMTRPSDDSFEAFVSFRENTMIKRKNYKPALLKDELVDEWEKFWIYLNSSSNRKVCLNNYIN